MQRCLNDYINQFETAGVEPDRESFLINTPDAALDPPEKTEWLTCAVADCAFKAMLEKPENRQSRVTYTSDNFTHSLFCQQEKMGHLVQIKSVDRGGCQSAAVSYMLSKHGASYTPTDIDKWMSREKEQYPTEIGEYQLMLELLHRGHAVKKIFPENSVNFVRAALEGFDLKPETYAESWLQYTDNEVMVNWFGTEDFQESFVETKHSVTSFMEAAQPYIQNGQLGFEWRDMGIKELDGLTETWGVMANIVIEDVKRTTLQLHAVVVEKVASTPANRVRAEYYWPNVDEPSVIAVQRAGDLSKIFFSSPDFSYLLVRPSESKN